MSQLRLHLVFASFILVLGSSTLANPTNRNCEPAQWINSLVNNTIRPDARFWFLPPKSKFKSRWGWVKEGRSPSNAIFDVRNSQPIHLKYPESFKGLAAQDPQLSRVVDDLNHLLAPHSDVTSYFQRKYGRSPTALELLDYYKSRTELLDNAFEFMHWRMAIQDPPLAELLKRSYASHSKKLNQLIQKAEKNGLSYLNEDFIQKFDGVSRGILGEVQASVVLENISDAGAYLHKNRIFSEPLAVTQKKIATELAQNKEHLFIYRKKYPNVFKTPHYTKSDMTELLADPNFRREYLEKVRSNLQLNHSSKTKLPIPDQKPETVQKYISELEKDLSTNPGLFKSLNEQYSQIHSRVPIPERLQDQYFKNPEKRNQYLNEVHNFIQSKEIDFVRTVPGKNRYHWVEVKNPETPIQLEKMNRSYSNKSQMTQLQENLEILDYLGLRNQVQVQFYSTQGTEPAALEFLKTHLNIEVLQ